MSAIRTTEDGVMLRPTRSDECVQRRAAEMALPELKSWRFDIGTDAEIIEMLMRHINGSDGYEIVKSLERDGWCGDARLVEIMGADFIGSAERELVTQWARCLNVTLDIPIGTPVVIKGKRGAGIVTKHYPENVKYGVRTPEQKENACWVVTPEEIEVAP